MEYENKNFLLEEGNTLRLHITPIYFVHGFVQLLKEYETSRKLKKLEWEKRCFFPFLSYFCIRCVKDVLGKLRYSCSEAM